MDEKQTNQDKFWSDLFSLCIDYNLSGKLTAIQICALLDMAKDAIIESFPKELLKKVIDQSRKIHCHADRDGDCRWAECPQLRDNEPATTQRHCPLD